MKESEPRVGFFENPIKWCRQRWVPITLGVGGLALVIAVA